MKTELYRIKPAAVEFFEEKYALEVRTLDWWQSNHVPVQSLEEAPKAYLTYGHANKESISPITVSLSGWADDVASYHFTLNVQCEWEEYDRMKKMDLRGIMQSIETSLNSKLNSKKANT